MTRLPRALALVSVLALAACAHRPAPPVVAVAPPPVAAPLPAMPAGGYPGMAIPAVLADGSYPTPNRNLSQAAAVWHLRSALNVAALACRGPQEAQLIAGYNALLAAHKAELATAETALAAEYRASGGTDWRDRYDDSMTRLYNFFSQSFVRDAFCQAAGQVLADATTAPHLADLAPTRLSSLDRPFTEFFREYDRWRQARMEPGAPTQAVPAVVIALAASPAAPPRDVAPAAPAVRAAPHLVLDLSALAAE